MTLTNDQRWLLRTVGLSISRALLSDAGLEHYMSSMLGHLGSPRDGAPDWMDSFETRAGKITSPSRGGPPRVVVTAAQIRAFRTTIPAELLTELAAIDKAEMAESRRTALWCHCPGTKPHKDFLFREQYHPTDDEDQVHLDILWALRDRENDCLDAILIGEPVGQLDLFEAFA